jgi:hypothetical protein
MITTKKVSNGEHDVYWKDKPTEFRIYNADMGSSGKNANTYGIHDKNKKNYQIVGSIHKAKKVLHLTMSNREKNIKEEHVSMIGGSPTNNVSDGNIAGLGVGPQGEPGVHKKRKKEVVPFKMFTRKKPQ